MVGQVFTAKHLALAAYLLLLGYERLGGRQHGSNQIESNESRDEGIHLDAIETGLVSELRQRTLASENLADERRSEANHGKATQKQLIGLGEAQLNGELLAVNLWSRQARCLAEAVAIRLGGNLGGRTTAQRTNLYDLKTAVQEHQSRLQ